MARYTDWGDRINELRPELPLDAQLDVLAAFALADLIEVGPHPVPGTHVGVAENTFRGIRLQLVYEVLPLAPPVESPAPRFGELNGQAHLNGHTNGRPAPPPEPDPAHEEPAPPREKSFADFRFGSARNGNTNGRGQQP
jgi:hypothetical protein